MIRSRIAPLFAAMAVLAGCAGLPDIRMADDEKARLKNYPGIRAVHHEAPPLTITTVGRVLLSDISLGTAGGVKNLATHFGIPDPAVSIKASLVQTLERDAGFKKLADMTQPLPWNPEFRKLDMLQSKYKGGTVLDVMTINWSGMYFASNWARYHLGYVVQARLVRLDDGKELWNTYCNYNSEKNGGYNPNMDELAANNGALLKKIYADAAKYCGAQVINHFMNRNTPQ